MHSCLISDYTGWITNFFCNSPVNEWDLLERPAHRPHLGRRLLKGELVRVRSRRGGGVTAAVILSHGRHDDGDEYNAAGQDTCPNLETSLVCSTS